MLTKLMALAVSALALTVTPSHASHATFGCGHDQIIRENVTNDDTVNTVLYGYIVSPNPLEGVSIRCYVAVNGDEYPDATTNLGAGTHAAVTAGPVVFEASDGDYIQICAEWTAGTESNTDCIETSETNFPPQEFFDLLCFVLNLAYVGVPGVVEIRPGGDIYVLNTLVYDC